jgi:membrane protein implicated in regulation of membrane protease activity
MEAWAIWLIASGVFFLIEIFTISFLFFWFGIGAFLAFIVAILGVGYEIQFGAFAIISILLTIFTKPLTKKLFKTKDVSMNNKSVIGKTGIVLKKIDNLKNQGQIKVSGEVWSAISLDDNTIKEGETVTVDSIDGVKLKVKKV